MQRLASDIVLQLHSLPSLQWYSRQLVPSYLYMYVLTADDIKPALLLLRALSYEPVHTAEVLYLLALLCAPLLPPNVVSLPRRILPLCDGVCSSRL